MSRSSIRVHLAAGASGSEASMRPWIEALDERGHDGRYVPLPRGDASRAVPAYRAAAPAGPGVVIGGQSFGGRVASLLAAEPIAVASDSEASYAGLILLCYPLHRPGHPATADERTAHWPRIGCPVLLLSGESDPFARIGLLRDARRRLPHAELVTYPGVGHRLDSVRDDAVARILDWLDRLSPR